MAIPPGLRSPALIPMQAERADRFIEKVVVEDDALAGMPHAALAVLVQPLSQPELHTVVILKIWALRLLTEVHGVPRPSVHRLNPADFFIPIPCFWVGFWWRGGW